MKYLLLFIGLLFFVPAKSEAQVLDPDYCWTCLDSRQHFAAGVVLDIAARGPYVAKDWNNKAWKRVLLVAGVGATYEVMQYYEARQTGHLGQPGYGFGPKDLALDVAGAITTELFIWVGRKIL